MKPWMLSLEEFVELRTRLDYGVREYDHELYDNAYLQGEYEYPTKVQETFYSPTNHLFDAIRLAEEQKKLDLIEQAMNL